MDTEEDDLKEVRVIDMYLECMYPMVPRAIAASDCCRRMASTTVELPNKSTTWRCSEHRGLIKGTVTGPVSETMFTRRPVPNEIVLSRKKA